MKLVAALALLAVAALFLAFPQQLREYRLYFTETRPPTTLSYEEMSQDWSEEQVRARLGDVRLRCDDNRPGEYLDQRSCFADVSARKGVSALSMP